MKTTLKHSPASGSEKGAEPKLSQEPPPGRSWNSPSGLWHRKTTVIAALSIVAILSHLVLRFGFHTTPRTYQIPLLITLALGGLPLVYDLFRKLLKREFGSDLLGGISIITSLLLGEYLAGSIIVLMLSGGEALESYALRSASSVLAALTSLRLPLTVSGQACEDAPASSAPSRARIEDRRSHRLHPPRGYAAAGR